MAENGATSRWQKGPNGPVMPELQSEFLDWLLMDPSEKDTEASSQAAWARQHGLNPRTLREWKADHRFRSEWDRRAAEKNVSTEKVQALLDMLHEAAIEGRDVQAAKLWLDHSAKLRPPVKTVAEGDYAGLSNEELVAELAAAMNFGGSE